MLRAAIILLFSATAASALTKGELFKSSVGFARAECAAFGEHEQYWPGNDSFLQTIWRSSILRNDAQDAGFGEPASRVVLKTSAWVIARYSLMDEIVWIQVYADWEPEPPANWYDRYKRRSESLRAAMDLYNCLRPDAGELAEYEAAGGPVLSPEYLLLGDCFADVAARIATAFEVQTPEMVHTALQPLSAQINFCGGRT